MTNGRQNEQSTYSVFMIKKKWPKRSELEQKNNWNSHGATLGSSHLPRQNGATI